jgi:hypothetical protein
MISHEIEALYSEWQCMAEPREKTEIRLEKKNIVRMRQRDEKSPRVSCEDTQQNGPIKPGRPKTMSSLPSNSLIFSKYKKEKNSFHKKMPGLSWFFRLLHG